MMWDQNSKSCFFSEEHQGRTLWIHQKPSCQFKGTEVSRAGLRRKSDGDQAEHTSVTGNVRRFFASDFSCQPGSTSPLQQVNVQSKTVVRQPGSKRPRLHVCLDQTQPASTEGSPMCWHGNGRREVTFPLDGRTRFPSPDATSKSIRPHPWSWRSICGDGSTHWSGSSR